MHMNTFTFAFHVAVLSLICETQCKAHISFMR